MTKKMNGFYENYMRSEDTQLWHVYGSYSQAKARAYAWCWDKYCRLNGERFRIISANCMKFTVGFMYPDPETGALHFCVETADHTYDEEM